MLLKVTCNVVNDVTWLNSDSCNFLADECVAVWQIPITAHAERINYYHGLLSPDELQRAGRYHQQKDKDRFIISRGALRVILGKYLQQSPAGLVFETGPDKKPFVQNIRKLQLHYNTTHSCEYILIAVAQTPVGIDVEQKDNAFPFTEILPHSFSETEIAHIQQSTAPVEQFYKLWTRKEALLKATGKGIDDDMKRVPCLDGEHSVEKNIIGSQQNWVVDSFNTVPGYICSLASGFNSVRFFDF